MAPDFCLCIQCVNIKAEHIYSMTVKPVKVTKGFKYSFWKACFVITAEQTPKTLQSFGSWPPEQIWCCDFPIFFSLYRKDDLWVHQYCHDPERMWHLSLVSCLFWPRRSFLWWMKIYKTFIWLHKSKYLQWNIQMRKFSLSTATEDRSVTCDLGQYNKACLHLLWHKLSVCSINQKQFLLSFKTDWKSKLLRHLMSLLVNTFEKELQPLEHSKSSWLSLSP